MHDKWSEEDMDQALKALRAGGIILYPTDTVWGLGCDAENEKAITKVYRLKQRDLSKPMIILVDSIKMLKEYVPVIHPRVETLLSVHERPLTIVYPGVKHLPQVLYSDVGKVAIRVVMDDFCKEMIHRLGKPLLSTSANISDSPFPKHFADISNQLIDKADYAVEYRREEHMDALPSVVATYDRKGVLEFLRT